MRFWSGTIRFGSVSLPLPKKIAKDTRGGAILAIKGKKRNRKINNGIAKRVLCFAEILARSGVNGAV